MTPEQIREMPKEKISPNNLQIFILVELTAQIAELNQLIYKALRYGLGSPEGR